MKTLNVEHYLRTYLCYDISITGSDHYNAEYDGLDATMDGHTIKIRSGKKTPSKAGYFTTLWIKDKSGKNTAYFADSFPDSLIVIIQDSMRCGHFNFPKQVLTHYGILASHTQKGKMGFRVYTPWDKALNHTATATQRLQAPYFHEFSNPDAQ